MKKCAAFLLTLICAMGLLGCADKTEETAFASHSDVEGISVQVESVSVSPEKSVLTVIWSNQSGNAVTYGEPYSIERLENGEWVDCALGENMFTMIGYLLQSNESVSKEYNLTYMYDISTPATYRFVTSCSVEMEGEHPKNCALWAEFEVK
jgi:hypothetical protein